MRVPTHGAQRASSHHTIKLMAMSLLALTLAAGGLAIRPTAVAAGGVKVVIVVGPVEGNTARYISHAREYAAEARSLGASVIEVYSPRATWARVKAAAKGANIFIYLGHGNGYPSPYGPFAASRRNGMGLNKSTGHGNSNVKYYGQSVIDDGLDLARNSVVLLNHLCYASGNSEPGRGTPSRTTAKQRVDGYGTGFLRTGAKAVFANGHGSLSGIISDILTTDKNMSEIFQSDRSWTGTADFHFVSKHTSATTVWLDPEATGKYYHAVVGKMGLTATQVRAGG